MSRSVVSVLGVTLALVFACAHSASAQTITSGGTFGSRSLGSGVAGSSQSRNQGLTQTGQISSNAAIQRQTGGFVGANYGNLLNIRSLTGSTGGQNRGNFGFGGIGSGGFGRGGFGNQGFNQSNRGGQNSANDPRAKLRTPMRLGFKPSGLVVSRVAPRLTTRFTKIPQLNVGHGTIAVRMEGRTAVLQGVVASDHLRTLAGRLALFEPGVSDVKNELVVRPVPGQPEELPPQN